MRPPRPALAIGDAVGVDEDDLLALNSDGMGLDPATSSSMVSEHDSMRLIHQWAASDFISPEIKWK